MPSSFALVRLLTWRGKGLFAGSATAVAGQLGGAYLLASAWASGNVAGWLAVGVGSLALLKRSIDLLLEREVAADLHGVFFRARLRRGKEANATLQEAAVVDALFSADRAIVLHLPMFTGSLAATVLVLAHMAWHPDRVARLLALSAAGSVALLATVASRRWARRAQERAACAYRLDLAPAVSASVRAAPEVIAAGVGDVTARQFAEHAARWGQRMFDASLAQAAAGRGIWLAGAATMWGVLHWLCRDEVRTLVPVAASGAVIAATIGSMLALSAASVRWQAIAGLLLEPPGLQARQEVEQFRFVLRDVEFRYEDVALWRKPLNLQLEEGQSLAVVGANGSGKSTLLSLLAGLRVPLAGTVTIGDKSAHEAHAFDFGYLPQQPHFHESQTVKEAMGFPQEGISVIEPWLDKVNLLDVLRARAADVGSVPVMTLSSGQRQRLAWARLLARQPKVMLLDEPEGNLDAAGLDLVVKILSELKGQVTIVLSTHDPRLMTVADLELALPEANVTRSRE